MRKVFFCYVNIVIFVALSLGISIAQELGGSGGSRGIGGGGSGQVSSTEANRLASATYPPVTIEVGTPEIANEEGIFIWLDENQIWQVRWKGEPGKFVWIRLTGQNPIMDVATVGERINAEMRGPTVLTIIGTTTSETAGVSFKCAAPMIDIDAKWHMLRDNSKIYLSGQKIQPLNLPSEIMASVYKDIVPSQGVNQGSSANDATGTKSGLGAGSR